jgi:DNA-binding transcriptional MerR regulator
MAKSADAFRTISEVAEWLDIQPHVLRFWESKFSQIKPTKRAGGRRYYRPKDMLFIGGLKKLLHEDGMTIKGAQKLIRERGVGYVAELSPPLEDGLEADTDVAPVSTVAPQQQIVDAPSGSEDNTPPAEIISVAPKENVIQLAASQPEPNQMPKAAPKMRPTQPEQFDLFGTPAPSPQAPQTNIFADISVDPSFDALMTALSDVSLVRSKLGQNGDDILAQARAILDQRKQ